MDKDVRKFVQSIETIPGVEVLEGTKHLRVWKDGRAITTIPKTPSDHRWRLNATAELRRAGITPSARPNGKLETVVELMPVEEIRTRLAPLDLSEFAKFVIAWQETSGLDGWANYQSAREGIKQIRGAKGALRTRTHERLDGALRAWDRIESQKAKAEAAGNSHAVFDETFENVEVVEPTAGPAITLRIDQARLTELLASFGVQLVIEGGE